MTYSKKVAIYPGLEVDRAMRCLDIYIEGRLESEAKLGIAGLGLFSYPDEPPYLYIYETSTQYTIRPAGE